MYINSDKTRKILSKRKIRDGCCIYIVSLPFNSKMNSIVYDKFSYRALKTKSLMLQRS